MEEFDGVRYVVHRSRDRMGLEPEWDNGNRREEALNRNIRELPEEKMGTIDGEIWSIMYHPIQATEETFIADCTIIYLKEGAGKSYDLCVYIDILTGECVEIRE